MRAKQKSPDGDSRPNEDEHSVDMFKDIEVVDLHNIEMLEPRNTMMSVLDEFGT